MHSVRLRMPMSVNVITKCDFTMPGTRIETTEYLISVMDGRPEDDSVSALYEASFHGCVSTLRSLMERDPLLLSRLSLTPFSETPLHIAALLGHLEFSQILLEKKTNLANETDSEGRCPLHLASAEGHTEVVRKLLRANRDTCLEMDQDDMLPLHLAVIRGRVQVIQELISVKPDTIFAKLDGDSVLHLCVRYNRLEVMKMLMELVQGNHKQLILSKDKNGNTVLHLAVMLRQIKTIKYLISLAEVRAESNALNNMGFRVADLLEHHPIDLQRVTIQQMLLQVKHGEKFAAGKDSSRGQSPTLPRPNTRSDTDDKVRSSHESKTKKWWMFLYKAWAKLTNYKVHGDWINETRGTVMIVATMIAAMTFQSTLNPPGGVWQENTTDGGNNCSEYTVCEAGTSVLAFAYPEDYLKFVRFNTTSFFSSLFVVFLLTSGFPLKNRVVMWVLTIAMCITLTFTGLTFIWAQGLVIPDHLYHDLREMGYALAGVEYPLVLIVGLLHTIRFFFWVKKTNKKKTKPRRSTRMPSTVSGALQSNDFK